MTTPLQSRLGLCILILGGLGLVRLLPEMSQMRAAKPIYWLVVGMDALFAVLMMAAGGGLRRGHDGARRLALWAAGVVVVTSIFWGYLLLPEVLRGIGSSNARTLLPRIAFYVIAVAFWPYGAKALVGTAPAESRKSLWKSFAASLCIGATMVAAIYMAIAK